MALNGGIARRSTEARAHLAHVDGVMLGRAAYQNPELLLDVDPAIFGESAPFADPFEALEAFLPVIARGLERGERLHDYTRHMTRPVHRPAGRTALSPDACDRRCPRGREDRGFARRSRDDRPRQRARGGVITAA